MSKNLQDAGVIAGLGLAVAASLHQDWRTGFEASKGEGAQRWKGTTDEGWAAKNAGAESLVRCDGNGFQVNINVPFHQLPADWQAENAAAGKFAVQIVANAMLLGREPDIEELASHVHDAWLTRRRSEPVNPGEVPYYVTSGCAVPYNELPEDEKQKDRDQIHRALDAIHAA